MRYTAKQLESDIARLNEKLDFLAARYRFSVGYRYGYTAIDLATPEQLERHCCQETLKTGTPRECLAACNQYVVGEIL